MGNKGAWTCAHTQNKGMGQRGGGSERDGKAGTLTCNRAVRTERWQYQQSLPRMNHLTFNPDSQALKVTRGTKANKKQAYRHSRGSVVLRHSRVSALTLAN